MALNSALHSALAGLQVNQRGFEVVASNVANADTQGYTKKRLVSEDVHLGVNVSTVRVQDVDRAINEAVQRQLRVHAARQAGAEVEADYRDRVMELFGTPGGANALDSLYNNFTSALEALSASPENTAPARR